MAALVSGPGAGRPCLRAMPSVRRRLDCRLDCRLDGLILDVLLPLVVNRQRFVELLFRDLGQRRRPDDERVAGLLADHCEEAMDRRLDRRIAEHLLRYLREAARIPPGYRSDFGR